MTETETITRKSLRIENIDLDEIKYGETVCSTDNKIKETNNAKKVSKKYTKAIYYENIHDTLIFQTPYLEVLRPIKKHNDSETVYEIDSNIISDNAKVKNFVLFIEQFEDNVVKHVESSDERLFKKKDVQFISLIRGKDNNLYIKLPLINNHVKFIDERENEINMSDITVGCNVR